MILLSALLLYLPLQAAVYTSGPPQDDPAPAVRLKQCFPVTICRSMSRFIDPPLDELKSTYSSVTKESIIEKT